MRTYILFICYQPYINLVNERVLKTELSLPLSLGYKVLRHNYWVWLYTTNQKWKKEKKSYQEKQSDYIIIKMCDCVVADSLHNNNFYIAFYSQRVQRRKHTVWIPATSEVTQILLLCSSWTKSCKFLIRSMRPICPIMFKILHLITLTVLEDLCKLCRFILCSFCMITLPIPTTSSVSNFVHETPQALISL